MGYTVEPIRSANVQITWTCDNPDCHKLAWTFMEESANPEEHIPIHWIPYLGVGGKIIGQFCSAECADEYAKAKTPSELVRLTRENSALQTENAAIRGDMKARSKVHKQALETVRDQCRAKCAEEGELVQAACRRHLAAAGKLALARQDLVKARTTIEQQATGIDELGEANQSLSKQLSKAITEIDALQATIKDTHDSWMRECDAHHETQLSMLSYQNETYKLQKELRRERDMLRDILELRDGH